MDWLVRTIEMLAVAGLGWLVYKKDVHKDRVASNSTLISDALQIKVAWKEMYEELEEKVEKLDREMDMVIRKGEMWRGVAVEAAIEYRKAHGTSPKWWPSGEPLPEVN